MRLFNGMVSHDMYNMLALMSNCGNAIYNDDFKRISCFGPNGLFSPFSKGYLLDYLLRTEQYWIRKYVRMLRKEEYYTNYKKISY